MNFVGFVAFRSLILLIATTSSILLVMLWLNIITMKDVIHILDLRKDTVECNSSKEITSKCESSTATALRNINSQFQLIGSNVLKIISQLLTKMFEPFGSQIDLSKIKVDLRKDSDSTANGSR